MVKDGSASKSVLTWGQDPDLTQQFLHSKAAMIIDGPWIFTELNAAGWEYNQQYLQGGPQYTEFAKEIETARPRTIEYGSNYPKVSQAIWTAIQAAITGTASVSSALQTAQGAVSGIPKVSS
jgi:ABC-type glycerol-3-phosphate transport system substrate-binding protein